MFFCLNLCRPQGLRENLYNQFNQLIKKLRASLCLCVKKQFNHVDKIMSTDDGQQIIPVDCLIVSRK